MKTRIKLTREFEDGVYKETDYEPQIYDFWVVGPFSYQPLWCYFHLDEAIEDIERSYGGYPMGTLQFAEAMIDDYLKHVNKKKVKRTEEVIYIKHPYEETSE